MSKQGHVFTSIRGRDGSTPATGVSPDFGGIPWTKAKECLNVDLDRVGFAKKRPGSTALGLTFSAGGPFSGTIRSLYRGSGGTLYAVDSTGQLAYLAPAATQWVEITVADAIDSPTTATVRFAQMRSGNLIVAYPNASTNRLHVWDGTTLRRAGMGTPSAPTVADGGGAGAYTATLRYYRARMGYQSGSVTRLMGEASASTSFTPSGADTNATVTKPSTVEHATHWRVEVSLDNAVWYVLSAWIVVATTTYADSAATTTYSTNDAAPLAGRYTNWTAVSYLTTDENRLIGGTTAGRIYFSPVRGTTDDNFFDEEFVPNTVEQKNWLDLDDDNSSLIGLTQPFQGHIFAFRNDAFCRLVPTQVNTAPFRVSWITKDTFNGPLFQECIFVGADESGAPALYWMSLFGPYRYGSSGVQFLGEDLKDMYSAAAGNDQIAVGRPALCFGLYCQATRQAIWWVMRGSGSATYHALVFHAFLGRVERPGYVRDGWSVYQGDFAVGTACVLYPSGVSGGSTNIDLRPYVAHRTSGGAAKLLYLTPYWETSPVTSDDSVTFQAYVDLPDRHFAGHDRTVRMRGASVMGTVGSQTLRLTVTQDYGAQSAQTFDVTMTADGSETRRRRVYEDALTDDFASALRLRIGDSAASTQTWEIDELRVLIEPGPVVYP